MIETEVLRTFCYGYDAHASVCARFDGILSALKAYSYNLVSEAR